MNTMFERQDIGYLLTAYADGQLAPEGVMWVEEQLDRNPDLRVRLKEIRHLQAGLRTAFAGGAPEFVLDLPRREALLANAANPPRKKLRFPAPLWIGLAASVMVVVVIGSQTQVGVVREMSRQSIAAKERAQASVLSADSHFDGEPIQQQLAQAVPAEAGAAQSFDYQKNDGEGLALRGQQRSRSEGDSLERSVDRLQAADKPANRATFAAQAAEPELLAKGQRDAAPRQGAGERKLATTVTASPLRPAAPAPAAAAPPAPTTPAPADVSLARTDRGGRAATKEYDGKPTATPSAPPAPAVTSPLEARPQLQEYAKQSAPDALDDSRSAKAKSAPEQAPAADRFQRLNETRAYNGALTVDGQLAKKAEQASAASPKNAAPAKPGAGPQTGKDQAIEQVPVALAEADIAAPLNQLDVPIEEKTISEDENSAEPAKGSEAAVAAVETGSTGAFMAVGAGGGSAGMFGNRTGGGKRRALTQHDKDADSFPVLKQVGGVTSQVDDDKPARVEVAITDPTIVPGTIVRITRNDLPVVDGKVVSLADGRAVVQIDGLTWNEHGAKIKADDVVSTIHPPGTIVPSAPVQSPVSGHDLLRQQVDPLQSLAALRAPTTFEGTFDLAQSLYLIGGEKIGYSLTTGALGFIERQVKVSLRDEPAARGLLRAVRSAGLQAQFTGGVVHLDAATRPLDPADSQGYDLPTFKDLFGTQPMQSIAVDPIQTVAIDADTASYEYAKARVASGQPVDPTTIKPEHFINAMPMAYPAPQGPEAFTLYAEAAPSPFAHVGTSWGPRTALVSIGAVAKPAAADERKPLALTLAIDCSGSMAQAGGLDRIQRGLLAFVEHLRAEDRVSIVAFGDQARVVLPATPGNDRAALTNALAMLATGGATNAAEGLGLAYQLAAETAAVGVESRVLLATDGGTVAGAGDLLRRVTAFKDRGITLVVVGTGQTYRAGPLQDLATKGDGQHFYVGSDEDAQALFTGKLLPDRLAVLAKDAKLQVTWNPQRVSHARLIGYDQRRLAAKDFRDNTVDAGELSQDTQVTALFEVLLVDGGAGPLGTAAVRYKDMRRDQVRELACPLPGTILQSQASDRLRLLACAAATAEWLQRGWWSNVHLITPEEIRAQLARCPQAIAHELRAMVK